jgi:outer membrane protein TolC
MKVADNVEPVFTTIHSVNGKGSVMKIMPIVSLLITLMAAPGYCQLTLDACRLKAKAHYPLVRQFDIIRQSETYTVANANKGYWPQINISGKATYQSEVTQIPKIFPSMPTFSMDKDQYQAMAEVSQVVWDGGAVRAQKKNARASTEAELKKVEADLYALNERVQQLFFGILLLAEQLRQNEILQNELTTNYNRVSACMAGGVANQADIDAIKVEQLGAQQRRIELLAAQDAYRGMLSILIGEEIPATAVLVKPEAAAPVDNATVRRPELDMFTAQRTMLESQIAGVNAGVRPKINLFLQGGYGRPGLNMLDDDFSPWYIGGVRLTWSLSGLYSLGNTRKKIRLEMDKIETLRETFLFTTQGQTSQQSTDIDKCRQLVKTDDEIIALRTGIKKAAEAKVENGTITVSDLLREINAENLAQQTKALHEIQLLMSIVALKNTLNN